jgi:fluoride exporter
MNGVIWVALGGALGAAARYGTGVAVARVLGDNAHWGNLACNVVGSFLTGLLFGALMRGDVNDEQRLFFGVGMLGAYAAFSFFSLDTIRMIEDGAWVQAFGYTTATILLSLGAIGFGLTLARGS